MYTKTIFVLVVVLAYAGVFLVFKKKYLSLFGGFEYLFVGFLISFLTLDTAPLKPLLYPFLGWIGLLIGLQLRFSYLKGLPGNFYLKVVLYILLLVAAASTALYFLGFEESAVIVGIALSSVCYKTAAHFMPSREKTNRFALFFISFLPFISILLLFGFYSATSDFTHLLLTLSASVAFSILLRMTLAILDDRGSVLLQLIGFIILISETCGALSISPIVVSFFVGIYITNFSHWKDFIFTTVYRDEKPLYTLYLALLGMVAGVAVGKQGAIEIVSIIIAVVLLKFAAFKLPPFGLERYRWYLFLAPGGFSIAVVTDYWLKSGAQEEDTRFSAFLISIIVLQFTSIFLGKRKQGRR